MKILMIGYGFFFKKKKLIIMIILSIKYIIEQNII